MAGRKLFQNVPVPDPELMRLLEATAGQVKLKPIHPGEILREGFMAKFDLSPNKLALALCVAVAEVYEIVNGGTVLKVVGFLINLAVVVYLLFAKRLFGVRGGGAAEQAERDREMDWETIESATLAVPGDAIQVEGISG